MRAVALALTLAAAVLVQGQAAGPPSPYLKPGTLDAMALIPPPPAAGSPAEAADRAGHAAGIAQKDGPRWATAVEDVKILEPGAFRSFACAAGAPIDETRTPKLASLLRRVVIDAGLATYAAKEHYARGRPFVGVAEPTVCVAAESLSGSAAYPSGHASVGWAWALILAELKPERANPILVRGREFGDSRVVCGVHWPTDVEAGRLVGAGVVARLHAEPAFQADLAAARAELAALPADAAPDGCS